VPDHIVATTITKKPVIDLRSSETMFPQTVIRTCVQALCGEACKILVITLALIGMVGILITLGHTPNRLEPRLSSVDFRLALETVALTLFNAHHVG